MSSYVNFYLRMNNSFAPIGSYSRSNEIYQAIQHAVPYEKITPLTSRAFDEMIRELESKAQKMADAKKRDQERIALIMNAANTSLDEKLSAVAEIESNFADMDEYISDVNFAADTFRVFLNIIDDVRYSDNTYMDNDCDHYIYAGIEAYGRMEDVIE